ncbi:MAG: hypothetical protein PVJ57_18710 [Phycisphaerae bacterium]|jgi:hypothetical protein
MALRSRTVCVAKWLTTLLCVVIAFAFLYSTRRAVTWTSPSLDQANLMLGAIGYGWIRDDAPLAGWKHAPPPGWSQAGYGGAAGLYWWVETGTGKYWSWAAVPLWMPFVLLAVPAAILWYRDRRRTVAAWRRLRRWLTPKRPLRLTVWRVLLFCVIHVLVLFAALLAFQRTYGFFVEHRLNNPLPATVDLLFFVLFWSAPLWAILWAWLWTRLRNRLLRHQPSSRCLECGYNLTGNVSGRCPECGAPAARNVGGVDVAP